MKNLSKPAYFASVAIVRVASALRVQIFAGYVASFRSKRAGFEPSWNVGRFPLQVVLAVLSAVSVSRAGTPLSEPVEPRQSPSLLDGWKVKSGAHYRQIGRLDFHTASAAGASNLRWRAGNGDRFSAGTAAVKRLTKTLII